MPSFFFFPLIKIKSPGPNSPYLLFDILELTFLEWIFFICSIMRKGKFQLLVSYNGSLYCKSRTYSGQTGWNWFQNGLMDSFWKWVLKNNAWTSVVPVDNYGDDTRPIWCLLKTHGKQLRKDMTQRRYFLLCPLLGFLLPLPFLPALKTRRPSCWRFKLIPFRYLNYTSFMLIIVVLQVWQLYKNPKRVHTGSETWFQWLGVKSGRHFRWCRPTVRKAVFFFFFLTLV